MNYDLTEKLTKPTQIEFTVDENRQYGQLPMEMLTTKFEETNMSMEDDLYDNYARNTLTNWGPDTNFLAHEEPRGATEARAGRLNLRLYGHRGSSDMPYHPELFIGFQGPSDWDPRGTADEPDMKKLVDQNNARMRFIRFSPDGNESITGGSRNEYKVMEDNQTVFKWVRDRMKWFSTQKDGRREGMRRVFAPKSNVRKCVVVKGYGDLITDFALNPQRRSVLISDKIIRDSEWHRLNCNEQDWNIMKFGESSRRRKTVTTANAIKDINTDTQFSSHDVNKCYRAIGLLLSELARGKGQMMQMAKSGDTELENNSHAIHARKHAAIVNDLVTILRSVTVDNSWNDETITKMMKTATPKEIKHMATMITFNHLLPANYYFNAELMYKSTKPGADMQKIRSEIITDSAAPDIRDTQTIMGKMATMKRIKGASRGDSKVDLVDNTTTPFNYKSAKRRLEQRLKNVSGEDFKTESINTQSRKVNHKENEIIKQENMDNNMKFGENLYAERSIGPIGNKYQMRDISRDNKESDIMAMS